MTGTLATVPLNAGEVMNKISKNPIVVFGLGLVTGYFVYKYRKEIINKTSKTIDIGKDFVLQQKENLEDIVAEARENP